MPRISPPTDLQLIAQRINKLAEIAALEHIDDLLRTQAATLLALSGDDHPRFHPSKITQIPHRRSPANN